MSFFSLGVQIASSEKTDSEEAVEDEPQNNNNDSLKEE